MQDVRSGLAVEAPFSVEVEGMVKISGIDAIHQAGMLTEARSAGFGLNQCMPVCVPCEPQAQLPLSCAVHGLD